MDVTCTNCGATNRSTGRFCARCGTTLPRPDEKAEQENGSLDLPWLQAVNDKAVLPTTGLQAETLSTPTLPDTTPDSTAPQSRDEEERQEAEQQAQAPEQQEPAVEPADAPPPNWVVSILEPSAGPATPEAAYEPEELVHIMPWAYKGGSVEDAGAEEEQSSPEEPEGATPGLPPWLNNVTVQETLQSVPAQDLRSSELVDLQIEDVEPFMLPASEEDQTPDLLPDFVRNMGDGTSVSVEDSPTQPAPMPTSGRTMTTPPGEFSLDSDLLDAMPHNVPVRPPRAGSVETLAALLQPVSPETTQRVVPMPVVRGFGDMSEASKRAEQGRGKVARWFFPNGLIYLLVLATLLAVVIIRPPFGYTPAPISPDVAQFYNTIESVPADRPVLVVYDWDAGRSAEMSLMSRAVMHHIMRRGLSFVTVSTVPQGPGFAQEVTDALVADTQANYGYEYGTDYLVLGYLPGSEAALRSLVGSFRAVLPLDYIRSRPVDSYQLTAGGALNKIEDFSLIIDLAGSEAEMRNWIEQVASRTGVPIIAAVPQGMEPVVRPYKGVPRAGLAAVVSGTTGANAYLRQLDEQAAGGQSAIQSLDLTTRLNAQSVAALLVVIVIIAAFLTQGARRIMRRG